MSITVGSWRWLEMGGSAIAILATLINRLAGEILYIYFYYFYFNIKRWNKSSDYLRVND